MITIVKQQEQATAHGNDQPEADVLRATLREITSQEEHHRAAEHDFWSRQIRAAHGLNWITGIGAAVGFVGLLFVGGSLIVAIWAANDAQVAADAAGRQANAAIAANKASVEALHLNLTPLGIR